MRSAAWLIALVALLGTAVAVPANGPSPLVILMAATGLTSLLWRWGRSWRSSPAQWSADVLDAAAVALVVFALPSSTQVLALPTAALFLRTLTPGPRRALVRLLLHLTAVGAGTHLAGATGRGASDAMTAVISALSGMFFITLLAALLGAALSRGSRASERDRLLVESGTRLLTATSAADVLDEATATAHRLVAGLPSVSIRSASRMQDDGGHERTTRRRLKSRIVRLVMGSYEGGGHLEVHGPARAVEEVGPPLAVLAQQAQAALRQCAVLEELRRTAETDALTGLSTRAVLHTALQRATLQATRDAVDDPTAECATLVVIDCDGFKQVNDSAGHAAGDAVLVEVARRLRRGTRPGDVVARLGGDEFAVLLQRGDGARRVEELVAALGGAVVLEDRCLTLTCSVGSAAVVPGRTGEALMHRADTAMYRAKSTGGGRHATFDGNCGGDRVERLPRPRADAAPAESASAG